MKAKAAALILAIAPIVANVLVVTRSGEVAIRADLCVAIRVVIMTTRVAGSSGVSSQDGREEARGYRPIPRRTGTGRSSGLHPSRRRAVVKTAPRF